MYIEETQMADEIVSVRRRESEGGKRGVVNFVAHLSRGECQQVVGQGQDCDQRFPEQRLGRRYALLQWTPWRVALESLRSSGAPVRSSGANLRANVFASLSGRRQLRIWSLLCWIEFRMAPDLEFPLSYPRPN